MGVFISWTRADGDDRPGRLATELRELGVTVWIDDEQIGPFTSIPDGVRVGLASASVFVAWYSAAYPGRRACREELTLALLAALRTGESPQRVLVVNPEPSIDHVVEAQLLDRRFAGPADIADLSRLAALIADRERSVHGTFSSLPTLGPTRWFGGEGWQGGSERFVGRLSKLWEIHDALTRFSELTGPAAARGVVVLSGLGGVGKSLLAAEYAQLFGSIYPGGIIWRSAMGNDATAGAMAPDSTRVSADATIMSVASSALGIDVAGLSPENVRERVKTELQRRGERTLWIVDDVPSGISSADLDAWRCPCPVVAELITTRDTAEGRFQQIRLDVLDPADALELMTGGRSLTAEDQADAALLAAELGYHPLACDIAGLYVRSSTTFAAYRRLIAGSLEHFDVLAEELSNQLPGDHSREITATLATSLNALGVQAWQLLRLAAQLAPVAIPRRLIAAAFAVLSARGQEPAQPAEAADLAGERMVSQALHDAHGDGLWRFDMQTQNVDVHVLVRQAALAIDPARDREPAVRAAAITALLEPLARVREDVRQHGAVVLDAQHARHLAETADTNRPDLDSLLLMELVGEYDYFAGRYAPARDMHRRVHAVSLHGEAGDALARRAASYLARDLADLGDLTGARDLRRHIYEANLQAFGADDRRTFGSASDLADSLRSLGEVAAARDLQQAAFQKSLEVLGPSDANTLAIAINLSETLSAGEDLAGARDLQLQAYEALKRALGADHPDTLAVANNLAATLSSLGELDAARELQEQTYEACQQILGDEHPRTLSIANNLGMTLWDQRDFSAARDLFRHTYDTERRVLGADHPNTLATKLNLAKTLSYLGEYAEATELIRGTYESAQRSLGRDHPFTIGTAGDLAYLLALQGERETAISLLTDLIGDRGQDDRELADERGLLEMLRSGMQLPSPIGDNGQASTIGPQMLNQRGMQRMTYDRDGGLRMIQEAAERGSVEAMTNLGSVLWKIQPEAARRWLEKAVAAGYPPAMSNLGMLLVEEDPAVARQLLERAAVAGFPTAILNLGLWLLPTEPDTAHKWLSQAAERGDPRAMFELGVMLAGSDRPAAIRWWERAAEAGSAPAMFNLGVVHTADEREVARRWFERAAAAGYKDAAFNLGLLLSHTDPPSARKWYQQAAEGGDTDAMVNLSLLLRESEHDAAAPWLERAATAGSVKAMNALGKKSEGTDPAKSREWYERAAETGDLNAMFSLGNLLKDSDPEAARRWLLRAADGGKPEAMFNLAVRYENDDPATARHWYERAAAAGDVEAMTNLAMMLHPTDPEAAKTLLQSAAEAGDTAAMNNLAAVIWAQDPEAAVGWLRRAAEAGEAAAMYALSGILAESAPAEASDWGRRAAAAGFSPDAGQAGG